MSVDHMSWAYKQPIENPGMKFVLVTLGNYAGPDNTCFPGQKLLAEMTGQGERTVRRHLDALVEAGFIRRTERRRKDGSRTSDAFELLVNEAPTGQIGRPQPTSQIGRANRPKLQSSPAKLAGHEPSVEPPGEPNPPNPPIAPPRKSTDRVGPGRGEEALRGLYNEDARKTLKRTDPEAYKHLEQAAAGFKWTYAQKNMAAEVILERRDEALAALREALEGANTSKGSAYRYWLAILNAQGKQPAKSGADSVDELLKLIGATGHHPDHGPFTVRMVAPDGRTLHTDNTPPLPPEEVRSCLTT